MTQLSGAVGGPIPLVCQDWAATKAAYRFLSNAHVSEREILDGHFQATAARAASVEGPVLVLQDTTEFSFQRTRYGAIGAIGLVPSRRGENSRFQLHTVCGLLMHGSLAITPEGLPLGLAAVRFWSRAKFKGTAALKRHINPTRVPIEEKESMRWLANMHASCDLLGDPARLIHIGDRENDIYEFFCAAHEERTHFLVRTCVDRLAGDGKHTIAAEMAGANIAGHHNVEIGDGTTARLALRFKRIHVRPPIGKQKRYPALDLTVLHAREEGAPDGRTAIDWKLITDLPVEEAADAVRMLRWYAMRWKIEVFHKILKSDCRAEDARLRTAERLVNLIAVFAVLAWRIFWMTMINRVAPNTSPRMALTDDEITLLDRIGPASKKATSAATLADYLTRIARLGGNLARAHDPPPGNIVMWRGWSRLMDIKLGAELIGNTYG